MRYIDRSSIETYLDHCNRQFYWQYKADGTGYVLDGPTPVDLAYGLAFHNGAEAIALGGGLPDALTAARLMTDQITTETLDGYPAKDEYYALAYGHLRSFFERIYPDLLARYDILACETEMVLPLSPSLVYSTRLDLGVRDKQTKMAYNLEYKTDGSPSDIGQRMRFYLQLLMESAALAAHLKEYVCGTIILGIDKGSKGKSTKLDRETGKALDGRERRLSPFTYYYERADSFGPSFSWTFQRGNGWVRKPTWLYPDGGLEGWYDKLLSLGFEPKEQFVQTAPVLFDQDRFESTKRQIVGFESRINKGLFMLDMENTVGDGDKDAIIDDTFPMNTLNCQNDGGYKKICPYIDLCHGAAAGEPLENGFVRRRPNHPLEITLNDAFGELDRIGDSKSDGNAGGSDSDSDPGA